MWKAFWIVGGFAVVGLTLAVAAASNASFSMKHPRSHNVRILVGSKGAQLDLASVTASSKAAERNLGSPKAFVSQIEYDFGVMNPLTMGSHDFVVRNVGTAPLKLAKGATTCKCTLSGLSRDVIPPGEEARVRMEWNTGNDLVYSHSATVQTSDPLQKTLTFHVRGKVLRLIGADVDEIVVPRVEPDQSAAAEILLYSQMWENFAVRDIQSALPGLKWELSAVDSASASELEAKAVQRLRITIPGNLPQGDFSDTLRLKIQPDAEDAGVYHLQIPIHGKVLRRFAVYGPGVTSEGVLELGAATRGAGKRIKFLVKVRDEVRQLPVQSIAIQPEFLQVRLEKHPGSDVAGLYDLHVEVPADAPPCQYLGNPLGEIRLRIDHPRIPEIRLGLSLAVQD